MEPDQRADAVAREQQTLAVAATTTTTTTTLLSGDLHQREPIVSPPYWQKHLRSDSSWSFTTVDRSRPAPIRLEDNTEEWTEQSRALWARHVVFSDYTVISGSAPGIGAYVVWNFTIETVKGGPITLRKRYSEFDKLRKNLLRTFPLSEAAIPELPRKSVISRFQTKFLEQRKEGLEHFLTCILLNPEFSSCPVIKDFLFC
ncbi:PX-domain-containing protein [Aulographum hederae CBS 113979]|uniref:Endosomal/vacuolar adapter protein YPT35 n=1 Tax=Aulographum hederae CBS 113979 TaxID=1176131 RepID=A0A6G1HI39_9PEZI|nr:PX-domain-containing protein [Aulographum hederae CBS 113979]